MVRGNHDSHAQHLFFVIPSDSRGIPMVRGNHDSHAQHLFFVIPSDSRGIP